MPQVTAFLTATLVNPDDTYKQEIPFEYPDGAPVEAALGQLVRMTTAGGGLLNFPTAARDEIEFIPMTRVKNIRIKLSSVAIATNLGQIADINKQRPFAPHLKG